MLPREWLVLGGEALSWELVEQIRAFSPSCRILNHYGPTETTIGCCIYLVQDARPDAATVPVGRPIAGTRRRGASEAEDVSLERELLADPKELAEHIMLVDLGRNDVGRVAKIGSVKVTELMTVERYSHVMHIVSNVVGELNDGMDAFDAFRATFPQGTVSGAPKIRAMEIIDELEPVRRGVYAGAVGYFSYTGNTDTAIALRTLLIKKDRVYIQAGGGVVADSDPGAEFEESVNKARAMVRALQAARDFEIAAKR